MTDEKTPGNASGEGRAPLWLTLGLAVVVFVMNVLIFAYAAKDGLPRASEPHPAPQAPASTGAGADPHEP